MRILLTGATGAVGSYHVPELLKRGHEVACLVRGENPQKRLAEVMPVGASSQVKIIPADITFPAGGISQEDLERLKGNFDLFFHHAGSVKFEHHLAGETFAANVGGTANMLSLAEELEIPSFYYNSSVYATTRQSRNPYEASKAAAERLVHNWRNGRFMILRPSIVVGHSVTGETNSYTGYYAWFAGFSYMKYQLRKLWDQSRSACQGFYFDSERLILDEPLWLDFSTTTTLNLVPIDWLVAAMTDLIEKGEHGRAYNLANPKPPELEWIIGTSFDILGIQGVKRREGIIQQPNSPVLFQMQQHMDRRLRIYHPYVTAEDDFGCDALKGDPPPINRPFLETVLRYAVGTRFGHLAK